MLPIGLATFNIHLKSILHTFSKNSQIKEYSKFDLHLLWTFVCLVYILSGVFFISHCCAILFTSFRSSQSPCLSPSRHTPFHVTDLSLGSLLSFLEHSFLLFHETAVLRRWSLLPLLIPLHLLRATGETGHDFLFFTFILFWIIWWTLRILKL